MWPLTMSPASAEFCQGLIWQVTISTYDLEVSAWDRSCQMYHLAYFCFNIPWYSDRSLRLTASGLGLSHGASVNQFQWGRCRTQNVALSKSHPNSAPCVHVHSSPSSCSCTQPFSLQECPGDKFWCWGTPPRSWKRFSHRNWGDLEALRGDHS